MLLIAWDTLTKELIWRRFNLKALIYFPWMDAHNTRRWKSSFTSAEELPRKKKGATSFTHSIEVRSNRSTDYLCWEEAKQYLDFTAHYNRPRHKASTSFIQERASLMAMRLRAAAAADQSIKLSCFTRAIFSFLALLVRGIRLMNFYLRLLAPVAWSLRRFIREQLIWLELFTGLKTISVRACLWYAFFRGLSWIIKQD